MKRWIKFVIIHLGSAFFHDRLSKKGHLRFSSLALGQPHPSLNSIGIWGCFSLSLYSMCYNNKQFSPNPPLTYISLPFFYLFLKKKYETYLFLYFFCFIFILFISLDPDLFFYLIFPITFSTTIYD